jgi:hypothetical protein
MLPVNYGLSGLALDNDCHVDGTEESSKYIEGELPPLNEFISVVHLTLENKGNHYLKRRKPLGQRG